MKNSSYYYCPGRGSNSRPSARRSFKHDQGVPRPNHSATAAVYNTVCNEIQTCQPSRFWRDSPVFLPDVPRPAKSWKCPAFCTKSDFFARAQFVTHRGAPTLMQITQLNVITEIPFDFSPKYQMVPRRIAVLQ